MQVISSRIAGAGAHTQVGLGLSYLSIADLSHPSAAKAMHSFTVLEWFTGSLGMILDNQRLQALRFCCRFLQPILQAILRKSVTILDRMRNHCANSRYSIIKHVNWGNELSQRKDFDQIHQHGSEIEAIPLRGVSLRFLLIAVSVLAAMRPLRI
jgi:hypothetical protein